VHILCESSRLQKRSKRLQKTIAKTIKRLQIPKTKSLCFLNVLHNMPQKDTKSGKIERSAFLHSSHRIKSLEETWS
jgi:hypothetical protein